jgi:hypothetical protein
MAKASKNIISTKQIIFNELSTLIKQSQQQVAAKANSMITLLFWQVDNT